MKVWVAALICALAIGLAVSGPVEDGHSARWRGDTETALKLLLPLAEKGNVDAQHELGSIYLTGSGVPINLVEAARWYKLAATQGNHTAQFVLGRMYDKGEGVPQDFAESLRWYKLSAAQGNDSAQYAIGEKYEQGRGVPRNHREAMRWYRMVAVQGFPWAQVKLGNMYQEGKEIPQDFVRAHLWFNLAAVHGDLDPAKQRDTIAQKMTPQQIAEAQQLARECLASNYKNCN